MSQTMIMTICCVTGAVWMLCAPGAATQRVNKLLAPPRPTPTAQAAQRLALWTEILRNRRAQEALWRAAIIDLCDGLSAELAAGRNPEAALSAAISVLDPRVATVLLAEWNPSNPTQPTRTTKELTSTTPRGPDTADVLDRLAARPGAEGLRLVAACWRIGSERGGTFATVIESLAAALRDEEAQRREVTAQLAGPRATARMLACLPLLGLAMAAALGAKPLTFLLNTLPGALCLVAGCTLDALGLWWTRHLATTAESPR